MWFIVATVPWRRAPPAEPWSARGCGQRRRGARGLGAGRAGGAGRTGSAPRTMGCGPSQPGEERRRVPAPRKGWEEGFKVKTHTHKTDKLDTSCLGGLATPTPGGDWRRPRGRSQPAWWLSTGRTRGWGGAARFRGNLTAVSTRTRVAPGLAFGFQEPTKVVTPPGQRRD